MDLTKEEYDTMYRLYILPFISCFQTFRDDSNSPREERI